ncbi:hypothetical protein GGR54DRAFT_606707 [Hypoxylon sp. NC1633]|nr:hypothetical protein GGR54DRAFT_606707 [Hypoxylon sp. NC1633]
MASPLLRHQSSLEDIIQFSTEPPLSAAQRIAAKSKFYRIIRHFETDSSSGNIGPYKRSQLVRLTYEYAMSQGSRDKVLQAFFRAVALSIDVDEKDIHLEELRLAFYGFADDLLDHFFLPLKAATKKTPQVTPTFHSAVQEVQDPTVQGFVGTPARVSALRGSCLVRDRYRCVISGKFDQREAISRFNRDGLDNARDDGGTLLKEDSHSSFEILEVAHILPHSLTKVNPSSQLVCSSPRE